jgi:hypothetical protein
MLKRVLILFLILLAGCGNPPAPKEKAVRSVSRVKKTPAATAKENPWTINSFAPKEGKTEGKKYVKFAAEGNFSDSTQTGGYLYAEVLFDKIDAGIFLHKLKKSGPVEKFNEPTHIKMTNSAGTELQMTSTRRWNSSGGIKIERNNNDYSQFRIFLLQSSGSVAVEISDSGGNVYSFSMNTDGFSDSFGKL